MTLTLIQRRAVWILVLCTGVWMALATVAGAESTTDFRSSSRVRYESDDDGTDVDFHQYLNINVRDIIEKHLDFRLHGVYNLDLNDDDEIDRAYNDSATYRVYEAALRFYDYGALSEFRLGRQRLPEVDYLHFDGGYLSMFEDRPAGFFLFGGRPVSFFSANASEWVGGGGVQLRPWRSTQIQADAFAINDRDQNLYAYALRWRQHFPWGFGDSIEVRGIENDLRDVLARARYYNDAWKFDVAGEIFFQPERLGDDAEVRESRTFSPYATLLRDSEEQIAGSLRFNKYLGDHYTLSAGSRYQRIMDRRDEGGQNFTNLDTRQFYLGLTAEDVPTTGLTFELYGNYFDNPEENFYDVTGELSYIFNPRFRVGLGVTHAEYNLNRRLLFADVFGDYADNDRSGSLTSRVYFFEAKYKLSEAWRIAAQAEYEDSDSESDDNAYSVGMRVDYHFRSKSAGKKTKDRAK